MARRWYVPLLALPVAIGTMVAVLVGVASASPGLTHPAARTAAVQRVFPGTPNIPLPGAAVPALGTVNPTALSTNWAGYVVDGRNGSFNRASAAWVEPVAHCAGVAGHRYSAFWVGLDGWLPSSGTVEQTGADSDCRGRVPSYYGWFEFFPAAPVFFTNRIGAGDHMSASVTFHAPRTYVLELEDSTRHWVHTIVRTAANKARSSAEFIAEAPSLETSTGPVVLPLANFGTMRWTGARVNGIRLRGLPQRLRLTMVGVNPPHRVKAVTGLVGPGNAFTNTYVRAN
jgi:Peptidase A4 family